MSALKITLEEGFDGDEVVVTVNGVERFRRDDLTTRVQIGKAASFDADVPAGATLVEVSLPKKNVSGSGTFDVAQAPFIGISLEADGIRFRHSSVAFGYV